MEIKRLPCDNIEEFIWGHLHFYAVTDGSWSEGDVVELYNGEQSHQFNVIHIIRFNTYEVLGLKKR